MSSQLLRRYSAFAAIAVAAPVLAPGELAAAKAKLFVVYEASADCVVYPNYPKPGVKGQKLGWTIPKGDTVIWRYNVNDSWAVVSDPSRSRKRFPWWGFTRKSCIGRSKTQKDYPAGIPVPSRVRQGRSHVASSGWREVDYDQGPAAIVQHGVRLRKNGTLRDRANFVVGNVFAEWHVDVTGITRSGGHWVYMYSPAARKWGYVEAEKLDR